MHSTQQLEIQMYVADHHRQAIDIIYNAIWPHAADHFVDPQHVVMLGDTLVGGGSIWPWPWSDEPGRYALNIYIDPAYERRGIGTELYKYMLDRLADTEPKLTVLMGHTHEDTPQGLRFLTKRGFQETIRWRSSQLDVRSFASTEFAELFSTLTSQGIQIVNLPQLEALDPDWQQNCYELDWVCRKDMISTSELVKRPFSHYAEHVLNNPALIPEAFLVALDGRKYIGSTKLVEDEDKAENLLVDFTGVVAPYRRRGIATALKVKAIEYAQFCGIKTIETEAAEGEPSYAMNLKLGFQPKSAWIDLEKSF